MKFLLDENVHIGLLSFLIGLGYDIKIPQKGIRNGEILKLCIEEKRILITRDSDFLDSALYPNIKNNGVILLRIPSENLKEQEESLSRLISKNSIEGKMIILYPKNKTEVLE